MRWPLFALILVATAAACKRSPGTRMEADAGPPATHSRSSAASPETNPTREPHIENPATSISALVDRWNAAHVAHDAVALEAVYAPTLSFYGTTLTSAECVKSKAAAFARAPDYTQSVRDVKLEKSADGKDTWARFVKMTKSNGKAADYQALLIVRGGLIIEENDDLDSEWCKDPKEHLPSSRIVPPFKVSAIDAEVALHNSKHVEQLRKTYRALGIELTGFGCAKRCAAPIPECGFSFRTVDHEATSTSHLVAWLYVDPIANVLWWEGGSDPDGGRWISEPLKWVPASSKDAGDGL